MVKSLFKIIYPGFRPHFTDEQPNSLKTTQLKIMLWIRPFTVHTLLFTLWKPCLDSIWLIYWRKCVRQPSTPPEAHKSGRERRYNNDVLRCRVEKPGGRGWSETS